MTNQEFIQNIRNLIAQDDLIPALQKLRGALENAPQLNEILQQSGRFQYIRKQIRLGTVSHAEAILTQNQIRFGILDLLTEIESEGAKPTLPANLSENIVESRSDQWVLGLRQDLLEQGVSVRNTTTAIMEHYGWLIEVFLQKMLTNLDDDSKCPPLLRLSYMAEAFQSTLRYLCYVQVAQIFKLEKMQVQHPAVREFLLLSEKQNTEYDYLNLLIIATEIIPTDKDFMPQIADFVQELSNTQSDVYKTALFLDKTRRRLLKNEIAAHETDTTALLDEYLTALIFWLRNLAFLAKYRLVSIKEINLNYRLGTGKKFIHRYGELHGIYTATDKNAADYNTKEIEDKCTYNQSVLLFRGKNTDDCLDKIDDPTTYISLSPLVIDETVFADTPKQTPEIYYFVGCNGGSGCYEFARFRNELPFGERLIISSNKFLQVKKQNNQQAKLNDLFKQLELVFKPFKTSQA
ncbi:MAG TPA: hypothetical protein PLC89_13975 [Haliscomenobacter sp.]|uniref:hypothetical protein n=1 Tax=Haliscomenobacter sp. TaxID=2717303 RepID=UPI002B724C4C|nr:hypothetical protein [Haliscomenobacter sp.]HOY18409.1 hypothetical protein [Haliscomenobacter sp.]